MLQMHLGNIEVEESMADLQYKRPHCDLAMKSIDTISFHQKFQNLHIKKLPLFNKLIAKWSMGSTKNDNECHVQRELTAIAGDTTSNAYNAPGSNIIY